MNMEELYEILLSDDVIVAFKDNEKEIFDFIPELFICKGFKQNNPWHIYDVYEHILHVIENVPKEKRIRLAALFHDIGKPLVYKEDENKVGHFKGHWKDSLRIFLEFANRNRIDVNMVSSVSKLIYYHDFRFKNDDDHKMDILINSFDDNELKELYLLKKADLLAQNSDYHYLLNELDKQEEILLRRYRGMK